MKQVLFHCFIFISAGKKLRFSKKIKVRDSKLNPGTFDFSMVDGNINGRQFIRMIEDKTQKLK